MRQRPSRPKKPPRSWRGLSFKAPSRPRPVTASARLHARQPGGASSRSHPPPRPRSRPGPRRRGGAAATHSRPRRVLPSAPPPPTSTKVNMASPRREIHFRGKRGRDEDSVLPRHWPRGGEVGVAAAPRREAGGGACEGGQGQRGGRGRCRCGPGCGSRRATGGRGVPASPAVADAASRGRARRCPARPAAGRVPRPFATAHARARPAPLRPRPSLPRSQ